MRNILIISIVAATVSCAPLEDDVEIEKQNVVRFPEDPKTYNNFALANTQEILDAIDKVNIKLGYKSARPSLFQNANQYLYSKPSHNSFGFALVGGGGKLEPSIRSLDVHSRDNYYRFPFHLPRKSKETYAKHKNSSIIQTEGYKIVGLFDKNNKLLKSVDSANASSDNVKIFLIPFSKLTGKEATTAKNTSTNQSGRYWEALDFKKYKDIDSKSEKSAFNHTSRPSNIFSNIPRPLNQNKPSVLIHSIKASLNSLINKPTVKPIKQNIIADKNIVLTTTIKPKPILPSLPNYSDETYYNDSEEKMFLPSAIKQKIQTAKEQDNKNQNEVLKDGGIIIQRLKVRRGGIAIAGPGGIATAGSGGTAIVGPDGLALTHPKSLTIAGPGARIIAYPADKDLKDVLFNADLIKNGNIVATGPTIYYNNGDDS